MAYLVIENFAGGTDRSRPIYASSAGTLWSGINGHMTRGGDFEKRKNFVPFYTIPNETTVSEYLTYLDDPDVINPVDVLISKFVGVAGTDSEVVIFINEQLTTSPAAVNGVTYKVITHPARAYEIENAAYLSYQIYAPKATRIVSYDLFDGLIYAIVEFDNGDLLAYYDGVLVDDSAIGIDYVGNEALRDANNRGFMANAFNDALLQASISDGVKTFAGAVFQLNFVSVNPDFVRYQMVGFATGASSSTKIAGRFVRTNADGTGRVVLADSNPNNVNNAATGVLVCDIYFDTQEGYQGSKPLKTYRYSIELRRVFNDTGNYVVGHSTKPPKQGNFVATYKRKVYSIADSLLNFSGLDDPRNLDRDFDIGAGFINMSNQTSGSNTLTAVEPYQDKLAIFSRRVIQIWFMDTNPDNNINTQILYNTGTRAPRSVVAYGDLDVFYLSDTGVRSIRARDSTNSASVNDVGTPVDLFIAEYLKTLTEEQIVKAIGLVEPIDSRYMLAVGRRIFVFSYFPSKKISAWTYYEMDYDIDDFFAVDDRVYLRSGFNLYLLGGVNNDAYGSNYKVTAQLPFLTGGKPASYKQIHGVDMSSEGSWNFSMLVNPRNLSEKVECGALNGVTLTEANISAIGHFTHVAPTLTHMGVGYASLSNVAIHFQGSNEE